MELEMIRRTDGKWAWSLRVGHDVIATDGSQGYENRGECLEMGTKVATGFYAEAAGGRHLVGKVTRTPAQDIGGEIMPEKIELLVIKDYEAVEIKDGDEFFTIAFPVDPYTGIQP